MFKRGDIVKFFCNNDSDDEKILNKRSALKNRKFHYLLVMKSVGDNEYLVALCGDEEAVKQICCSTNCGELYVDVRSFFPIDGDCLVLCDEIEFVHGNSEVVKNIYTAHNRYVERDKQKRAKQEAKRIKQKEKQRKEAQKKREMYELERKYKRPYQIAVINNDRAKMKEIENILGFAPGLGHKPPQAGKEQNAPYTTTNAKPYSGGGFSPK